MQSEGDEGGICVVAESCHQTSEAVGLMASIYEAVFLVEKGEPVLILTDGDTTLARFAGPEAYERIGIYIDESL